jgi:hypothetical protein
MNQGTEWGLLMKKNRSQKSRASVPLTTVSVFHALQLSLRFIYDLINNDNVLYLKFVLLLNKQRSVHENKHFCQHFILQMNSLTGFFTGFFIRHQFGPDSTPKSIFSDDLKCTEIFEFKLGSVVSQTLLSQKKIF